VLRQKNVAGYSAEDLRAVLGTAAVLGARAGGAGDAVALPSAPLVTHASETSAAAAKRGKAERAARRERKEQRRERRRAREEAAAAAASAATEE